MPKPSSTLNGLLGFALALGVVGCDDAAAAPETGETGETGVPWENTEVCPYTCASGNDDAFVDCVHNYSPGAGTVAEGPYNEGALPAIVQGPPGGSLDALSLGCDGSIVVGFDGAGIANGPGADFIVFENPFDDSFPEPGRVEVSDDGCTWVAFDCDPLTLMGCAGVRPVQALPGTGIDPLDAELAGGDAFDLDEISVSSARFVRIVDRSAAYWDAQGMDFCDPGQGGKGGFDLDAVAVLNAG